MSNVIHGQYKTKIGHTAKVTEIRQIGLDWALVGGVNIFGVWCICSWFVNGKSRLIPEWDLVLPESAISESMSVSNVIRPAQFQRALT